MTSTADRDANLATADRLTRDAAALGATLVVLPEKWPVLAHPQTIADNAEPLDGPAATWASKTAKELQIDLVAGSLSRTAGTDERNRNTCLHFGPDGELKQRYDKLHMFDVEVGGVEYKESEHEAPGTQLALSQTAENVRLGLTICYDLRFPELYRALAAQGAEIMTVPAAFTLATTREHWETLLKARAIEDQCFVVAANQVGRHAKGLESGGRSMIVDPWGVVLAQAHDAETVITADLDLGHLDRIRRRLPSLANRRPQEIYE